MLFEIRDGQSSILTIYDNVENIQIGLPMHFSKNRGGFLFRRPSKEVITIRLQIKLQFERSKNCDVKRADVLALRQPTPDHVVRREIIFDNSFILTNYAASTEISNHV